MLRSKGASLTNHIHELPIPAAAGSDSAARELVRIWAAGGAQHVSVATGLWSEPAYWGIMLVDLARHIADAYQLTEGRNPEEVLARIPDEARTAVGSHPRFRPAEALA